MLLFPIIFFIFALVMSFPATAYNDYEYPPPSEYYSSPRLDDLMKNHAIINSYANINYFDTTNQQPILSSLQRMDIENSSEIIKFIGEFTSTDKEKQFIKLWNSHTDLLKQYALARKNNDDRDIKRIDQELNLFIHRISDIFVTGTVSKKELADAFKKHINNAKSVINNYAKNNKQVYASIQNFTDQVDDLADLIYRSLQDQEDIPESVQNFQDNSQENYQRYTY